MPEVVRSVDGLPWLRAQHLTCTRIYSVHAQTGQILYVKSVGCSILVFCEFIVSVLGVLVQNVVGCGVRQVRRAEMRFVFQRDVAGGDRAAALKQSGDVLKLWPGGALRSIAWMEP